MRGFMSYDRADLNYSTEMEPLPPGHAATHIGMFLAWVVEADLIGEYHQEHSTEALERLRKREITGRDFFLQTCGDRFAERDLNDEGNAFVRAYYEQGPGRRGRYFEDYRNTLAAKLASFWHVADTWRNYDLLAPVIRRRHQVWRRPPRRWWQFWRSAG